MKFLSKIGSGLKHAAAVAKVGLKEKSPEILVGTGIVLMGAAAVMAVKGAIELSESDILEDRLADLADVDRDVDLTDKEKRRLRTKVHLYHGWQISKKFAPAFGLFALGTTCILVGHDQLKKRYLALGAAYNALDRAYAEYRKRIIEKYGDAADKFGRYGIEEQEYTETETDPETGKKKKVKKTRDVVTDIYGLGNGSPYFRTIGPGTAVYDEFGGNPLYIRNQLELMQNVFNQQYNDHNPIWTNDIYRAIFGTDESVLDDNGQLSGYFYDDPVNREACDGYVDLRIGSAYIQDENDEMRTIFFIDPNVPGEISLDRAKQYRLAKRKSGKYISM